MKSQKKGCGSQFFISYRVFFPRVSTTLFIFSSVGERSLLLLSFNSVSPGMPEQERDLCSFLNGSSSLVSQGESRAEMSLKCCPTGGLGDFAHLSQVLCAMSVRAPSLAGSKDS